MNIKQRKIQIEPKTRLNNKIYIYMEIRCVNQSHREGGHMKVRF